MKADFDIHQIVRRDPIPGRDVFHRVPPMMPENSRDAVEGVPTGLNGKPISVCLLISSLEFGGAERQVVEMVRSFDRRRIRPLV